MKVLKKANSDQNLQPPCRFFSISFPVFFNFSYKRRKIMIAVLFGIDIIFKCRSAKVMV